ncbi:MAG: transcriptional regulator [Desulfovibrio desulfuricans]|jgi:predicted transcriptional regulator|nr:transcriptional regulator [Desulfovibrio desulfuricans]
MDDYLKEAVELARAQAGVRVMSEDEIAAFVAKVATSLRAIAEGGECASCESGVSMEDAKKSIKEKSVTCLECGKSFKILTKRHLAQHGLTSDEYRDKYGLKKGTALVCKALQRERRKKMAEMQLWEKRRKPEYKKA